MSFTTLKDVVNNGFVAQSLVPAAAQTATVAGPGVDCSQCDGPINGIVNIGAATGSPSSFSVVSKLQESVDNSTWTDITNQQPSVTQTAAGIGLVRGMRAKQYVRVYHTITFVGGTSPAIPLNSLLIGQLRDWCKEPGMSGY